MKGNKILPNKSFFKFILNKSSENNNHFNYNFKNSKNYKEMWKGSPDTNNFHLRQFFNKDTTTSTVDSLLKIADIAKGWFDIPHIDFNNPDEMAYCVNFNKDAYPGYYTSSIFNGNKKGSTVHTSLILSKKLYKLVRSTSIFNNSIWTVLAREKEVKIGFEKDKEVSTRYVSTTEEHIITLTSWVMNKIMFGFRMSDNSKFHCNGEFDGVKLLNLNTKMSNYDWIADADWTLFDSSIDKPYLEAACLILFSNSIKNKYDLRLFYYIMCSIIYKNIAIPPGIVCRISRGNPSGHPCVTIINNIVNLLRWAEIGQKIYGDNFIDFMHPEVYGDDAIILFKDNKNLNNIDDIIKDLKFNSDSIKNRLFPCDLYNHDNGDIPDFLKRTFTLSGISWNPSKIISKLYFQSKNRNDSELLQVIFDYLMTGPCDNNLNEYLYQIALFIKHNNNDNSNIDENFNKIHHFITNDCKNISIKFKPQYPNYMDGFNTESNLLNFSYCASKNSHQDLKFRLINNGLIIASLISNISIDYMNILDCGSHYNYFRENLRTNGSYDYISSRREYLENCLFKYNNSS